MDIGWRHFRGLAVMAVGVYWIVKRDVPIGIEGRPALVDVVIQPR